MAELGRCFDELLLGFGGLSRPEVAAQPRRSLTGLSCCKKTVLLLKLRLELLDFLEVQLVLSGNVWLVVLEELMHILNFLGILCQLDAL